MNFPYEIIDVPFKADTSSLDNLIVEPENEGFSEKCVYDISELLTRVIPKNQHLWGPFLSKKGLAAIVGCPDSGKSMFCRELALSIALGKEEFAGFPLDVKHGRAIYVSTEDGADDSQAAFLKQSELYPTNELENPKNLKLIFPDLLTLEDLIQTLILELREHPADLVVLDSYGDLFNGKELNSNTDGRKFLKQFSPIVQEFGCLLLFITHINKSGYKDSPNQRHVQGATALVQKLRTVLDLRQHESDEGKRYLSIIKGNGISKKWKKNAIEFEFNEETLTFSNTGNERPKSDFDSISPKAKDDVDYTLAFESNEEGLRHTPLVERMVDKFGVSRQTAIRKIKIYFKKVNGLYLNPRYQGIIVSTPIENDTMIPDTNEQSETISEEMQNELALKKMDISENHII